MNARARGMALVELIVAMGIALTAIGVGYQIYNACLKADDRAARRETMTLAVQNLMARVKQDVRVARSISVSGGALVTSGERGRVSYRSASGGVERSTGRGRCVFRDISARFEGGSGGVKVRLTSDARVHRRPIHIEVESYVASRNR